MKDMTNGSATGHLFSYAVPLILSNWFQMGYNVIDSIIVGRYIGKDALAAVGIASPLMNLVILSISGLCIGSGVLMSELLQVLPLVLLPVLQSVLVLRLVLQPQALKSPS